MMALLMALLYNSLILVCGVFAVILVWLQQTRTFAVDTAGFLLTTYGGPGAISGLEGTASAASFGMITSCS